MFKARGIFKGDKTRTVNEIKFDNGKLTGDLGLILFMKAKAKTYELRGHFPDTMYSPDTLNFVEDGYAVVLLMDELCESVQFSGDVPKLEVNKEIDN